MDPTTVPDHGSAQGWRERWMRVLRRVGNIQAWIILTLFYWLVLTPFGLAYRLFADPLRRHRPTSNWQPLATNYDRLDEAGQQS